MSFRGLAACGGGGGGSGGGECGSGLCVCMYVCVR